MLKSKKFYLSLGICFLMVVFAVNNKKYTDITFQGIVLWAVSVVPSVFPYFVFTAILTSLGTVSKLASKQGKITKPLFGCGGLSGYALLMSIIGGYPTGSKITSELYENRLISYDEAVKMSAFCTSSSPLFIIGTIGGVLNNTRLAVMILIAHFVSVILSGIILKGKSGEIKNSILTQNNIDNVIYEAVYGSIISLLVLGGIITLYYVVTEMLFDVGILTLPLNILTLIFGDSLTSKAVISGLFECTKGIKLVALSGHFLTVPLIGFLISFGGFSVITQSLIFLKRAKIKTARFMFSKLLQAVLTFIILIIFYFLKFY